ncbi:MAG: GntR family transcriptional regulator [Alphaproteobacteria bacterium]|nr:GntR family transcriptional regulator [Alphaproteobacteria bacterium]MBT4019547.1 GntR family transcriptional regulator [Alphaproteobacteria bacterium]MBT5158924.1 GntR family transcriptional regulator [Alphaproteobacteria bacterium]MBT5919366.1 GntR family transcriptional regulator [Alphaproteobacteria bacterium]MBT6385048.1 GntR family transcriptional regulator [Alphaproteobacteria bacterium]
MSDVKTSTDRTPGNGAGMRVDEKLPTPLYHQIYMIFRNKILNREYVEGNLLPSEDETSRIYNVSRITAKRALNDLAEEGLVVRERGRGTRVIYRGVAPPVKAHVEGMLENIMSMGLETEVTLLEFDYMHATDPVASAIGCTTQDVVQRAVRVRHLEAEPFSHLLTYVPESVGRSYTREDLATTPLLILLERSGVEVTRAEQTLTATAADPEVAALLGVDLTTPLLRIQRIVYDQLDRPVEFITGLYRPDRYQYRMDLSRVQANPGQKAWSPTS